MEGLNKRKYKMSLLKDPTLKVFLLLNTTLMTFGSRSVKLRRGQRTDRHIELIIGLTTKRMTKFKREKDLEYVNYFSLVLTILLVRYNYSETCGFQPKGDEKKDVEGSKGVIHRKSTPRRNSKKIQER